MNKCKFFFIVAVLSFASVGLFQDTPQLRLSEMNLENIDALANVQSRSTKCWKRLTGLGGDLMTHKAYCADCKPHLCNKWENESVCN